MTKDVANKVKKMFQIIDSFGAEKIKSFSIILILIGACLIYFTFRLYEF